MRSKDVNLMEKIKAYVEEYALDNFGATPSTTDIGEQFNFSRVSAYRYLVEMDKRGMIQYKNGEIHTELIDKIDKTPRLVGALDSTVPAGSPDMLDEVHVEEYMPIPSSFVKGMNGKFYAMTVCGESMVDAGVDDGDMVIFKEGMCPGEDDIVVAFIPGEGNTLKRYCIDEDGPYLWAENEQWTDKRRNFGRNFEIRGIAIKVVKDL